ncbi:L-serine ammonia-lyase [Bartonella sp. DGB1]|uniref:L-serine ammonia-lyase n=1 Tax=Bartonella sp. DGB1 TaxID=3239807 RepID=UPI003525233E
MISVLDIFKIGIGPSSSHTVGPMKAAYEFINLLAQENKLTNTTEIYVKLHGSLSLTGKGHASDKAVILGLAGNLPDNVDVENIDNFLTKVNNEKILPLLNNQKTICFSPEKHIEFCNDNLPLHENGLIFYAFCDNKKLLQKTYYSIGGGFITTEEDFNKEQSISFNFPYPFQSASDLTKHCLSENISLSELVMRNELSLRSQEEIELYFQKIWLTMQEAIQRGLSTPGYLPGCLKLPRRANSLLQQLQTEQKSSDPMQLLDWLNLFAFAVSEENAAGGRIVTSPTNGACGIIPAVLNYYNQFIEPLNTFKLTEFFLVSGVIGVLYKMNASISGAEVGCQGEVGVACSMAAAGLTHLLGGNIYQIEIAAEIAMEHHLGMTCDPVAGLVQIPCIERNAIAAVKAYNATRMALRRTSDPRVNLDQVIITMYETGKDMHTKYRETSIGGLAKTINQCG